MNAIVRIMVIVGMFLVAGAQAKTITVDGNISDWSDVPVLATDPVGDFIDSACGYNSDHRDLASIKMTSDAQNLYYLLQYGRYCYPYNGLSLFFDTDSNNATGCPTHLLLGETPGIGADMFLSLDPGGTNLFSIDNACATRLLTNLTSSIAWNSSDPTTTYVEGSIPLSYFPNSSFKLQSGPDGLSAPAVVSLTPASNAWLWPIKGSDSRALITQDFAEYQSYTKSDGSLTNHHTGFDIGVPVTTPVVAVTNGTVVLLQRNLARDGTCSKRGTLSESGNCGDHGDGNTIILQHRIGSANFPTFIYSQYQHLNDETTPYVSAFDENKTLAFNRALLARIKAESTCKSQTNGMILCQRDQVTGNYPVSVNAGDIIGFSGRSGNGNPTQYAPHLHFELKSFATLGAYNPDKQIFEYGYTYNLPRTYGLLNPSALLDQISDLRRRFIVRVNVPTIKHIGPRNDYSCGLYILNPPNAPNTQLPNGCPPVLGSDTNPPVARQNTDPKVGDLFIAFQEAPSTPGCSMGWYQIAKTSRDIFLPRSPGKYFQRNLSTDGTPGDNLSRDGLVPDGWLCKGDAGVEWVSLFRTGDVNGDGAVDQSDLCAIKVAAPRVAGATDPRDLNGDGKINTQDVNIEQNLCSPTCSAKACH